MEEAIGRRTRFENRDGAPRPCSVVFPLLIRSSFASDGEGGKYGEDANSSTRRVASGETERRFLGSRAGDSNDLRGDKVL